MNKIKLKLHEVHVIYPIEKHTVLLIFKNFNIFCQENGSKSLFLFLIIYILNSFMSGNVLSKTLQFQRKIAFLILLNILRICMLWIRCFLKIFKNNWINVYLFERKISVQNILSKNDGRNTDKVFFIDNFSIYLSRTLFTFYVCLCQILKGLTVKYFFFFLFPSYYIRKIYYHA